MSFSNIELVVLFVVSFIFYKWFKNIDLRKKANLLPGPPTFPVVGNGLAASNWPKGILDYLCQAQRKYGTVTRHWLGTTLYTMLTDPQDVEIVLKDTKNLQKSSNYDLLKPWLGEGLVTSKGQHWHKHRKILTPAFHFNILEKFINVFHESGTVLVGKLLEKVDGPAFDIYPYITLFALDSILETAMGMKMQVQEDNGSDYINSIHVVSKIAHKRTFNPLLRSPRIFPFTSLAKKQKEVLKVIHGHTEKVIQQKKLERKAITEKNIIKNEDDIGAKKRHAFLDLLIKWQHLGIELTDQHIREEVNTFTFAGHDTTASGISFTLYHLSNHQDFQQKIYEEIESVFGNDNREPTYTDLQSMNYLEMFVKESLRLSAPIPFISRLLEEDLKISNYVLPKGSTVSVFQYMLHRNPEFFPDPEKFDPERFSPEQTQHRHPYAFVPFSAGPRNCIGQKFAMLEMKSTVVQLLRNYIILPGEKIHRLEAEVVLKSPKGINIKICKRNT